MYVYYLTASLCMTNIPAECKVVWQHGPYKTAQQCQAKGKATQPHPSWNKLTCYFGPTRRT